MPDIVAEIIVAVDSWCKWNFVFTCWLNLNMSVRAKPLRSDLVFLANFGVGQLLGCSVCPMTQSQASSCCLSLSRGCFFSFRPLFYFLPPLMCSRLCAAPAHKHRLVLQLRQWGPGGVPVCGVAWTQQLYQWHCHRTHREGQGEFTHGRCVYVCCEWLKPQL